MKTHLPLIAAAFLLAPSSPAATQTDIPGPPGSGAFGYSVTVLPNGNYVVTDPFFDQPNPPVADIGAVYLYTPDGHLISSLYGSTANDRVGYRMNFFGDPGITVLANGNFVVHNPDWNGGAGAATWGSAATGFIGGTNVVVSAENSLVGSSPNDHVGDYIFALTNGNYLVRSPSWNNGSTISAGAITWGNGTIGIVGPVSSANSLVGTSDYDYLGALQITELTNGNYVVNNPDWDNPELAIKDVGAVTWGSGTTGVTGPVSSANSLVGTSANDRVGEFNRVTALTNGNYVVASWFWDNGPISNAGAFTLGSGFSGIKGPVSTANSVVGTSAEDQIGSHGITALTNGNYVVASPFWDNDSAAAADAGAVTWGNGTKATTGTVSPTNSLVGTTVGDAVGSCDDSLGSYSIIALTNGNYIVRSQLWYNAARTAIKAGAVTWGNGTTGITGPVSLANSLVGTSANDQVGSGATALTNGNYVVNTKGWDNSGPATVNVGAVTWGNGNTGIKGPVSAANSLVGTSFYDEVGSGGITALTNGNYVVSSYSWDNIASGTTNAGAATWGSGATGIKGSVSPANSLVGTSANDYVGYVTALTNGHYVVTSSGWDNPAPAATDAGAVTWGSGTTGIKGAVSPANSLVGSTTNDRVGSNYVVTLTNGHYVVPSSYWDNPSLAATDAGAVTWGNGFTGIVGPVTAANSLVGTSPDDKVGYDQVVTLFNGNYIVHNSTWDSRSTANSSFISNAGATSLCNGATGTSGTVGSANSILGKDQNSGYLSLLYGYDPDRNHLLVGRFDRNFVTLFRGDRLRSQGITGQPPPGSADIVFVKPGTAAVNPLGTTLADLTLTLTGSGSTSGRNRALFAFSPNLGTDLVLQTGTPISALSSSLPANTTATTLLSQLYNRSNLGLFQATVKGTGITTANNRLLLLDNGASVQLLHRTGTPVPSLANATISAFSEVLQSHDQDLITLAYKLKSGSGVTSANDDGLLFLNHSGTITSNIAAREGQPAFGGSGNFGSFNGRAAAGLGNTIHFTALFKPTAASPVPAVFSTTLDGLTTTRLAQSSVIAPNSGGASYSNFTAITHQTGNAFVKATLKFSATNRNEGVYSLPANTLLIRKGDTIGSGITISRIIRFWPAGPNQVILQVQLTGVGVNTSNNQALILRQSDGTYLTLLRTGTPAPGTGPAKLATLSAIDVNPVTGLYAVLGTLSGAPSSSNQALWTGDPTLGNDTTQQILRLPQLTLRKGNPYSTESTPNSIIRSIALKPALDPTGAGGRGLAQALGANGDLALFITTDRNMVEIVLLDR
jgi:hypothetical protein